MRPIYCAKFELPKPETDGLKKLAAAGEEAGVGVEVGANHQTVARL